MKTSIFSVCLVLFLFCTLMTNSLSGQCMADAGESVGVCTDSEGQFSPQQLEVHISGGTPPYTIRWEANHPTGFQNNIILTASHFLEDTTVAIPTLINGVFEDSEVVFHVFVEDSTGMKCRDSVGVLFSSFLTFAIEMKDIITKGDTTTMFSNVDAIIQPSSYTWSPDYNISDIHSALPDVWPDTTTCYELTLVDALGCVFNSPIVFKVVVDSTTHVIERDEVTLSLRVFPNPASDYLQIKGLEDYAVDNYRIYALSGKLIKSGAFSNLVDLKGITAGTYLIRFISPSFEMGIQFVKME
nr:T9SS type A sorting domain-containing protein [Saprospiraceae bacterium]